jgi:hypothetical protein
MIGKYAWVAGASAANIIADIIKWITGADLATMSAACNQAATTRTGSATTWSAHDAAFGVIRDLSDPAGPGIYARLTSSASPKLQAAAVAEWDIGSHAAAYATTAGDVSLTLSAAGSVNLLASSGVLLIGAADWSVWSLIGECARASGVLAASATVPGTYVLQATAYAYMVRAKNATAAGFATSAQVGVQSSFGQLNAAAVRDVNEALYHAMASMTISFGSAPVGEARNVMVVGGYSQSGDTVVDQGGVEYLVVRSGTMGQGYAIVK